MEIRVPAIAVSTAALAVLVCAASADVVSTFDVDAEGWGTLNDANSFTWTDAVGNPAGAIRAIDNATGQWWFFSASDAYLGNKSSYYGGELSWDIMLLQGSQNSGGRADVMLVGGGLSIGLDAAVAPVNGQWTSWSVMLDTSSDWRHVNQLSQGSLSSNVVTTEQFQTVLADLTGLYIRGEYTNGSDAAALDNVMLIPAPATIALFTLAVCGTRRRRY